MILPGKILEISTLIPPTPRLTNDNFLLPDKDSSAPAPTIFTSLGYDGTDTTKSCSLFIWNPPEDVSPPPPTPTPLPEFRPQAVDSTKPANLLKSTDIKVGDSIVDSFTAKEPIDFGLGKDYTEMEGIVTFRGNNFREGGAYGVADITEKKFNAVWKVPTYGLADPTGFVWGGHG